jgi:hypothetical protein
MEYDGVRNGVQGFRRSEVRVHDAKAQGCGNPHEVGH